MSGIGMLGREGVLTVSGQKIAGAVTKGVTCNNEPVDVTDDDSSGWRELMARPGLKTIDLPISGQLKNLELFQSFFNAQGGSQIFPINYLYADGSTIAGNFFLTTIGETGDANGAKTFDSSWQSAGEIIFTPGV